MLTIQNLSKSYGNHVLFEDVNFQMNAGEKLGLVGRNGHGKSTLFKLILKQEDYDSGSISLGKNYHVGHLAQHLVFTENTILQEVCLGLPAGEELDHYKAEAMLFGLGFDFEDLQKHPSEFSGGFQIRLNLAKVLLSKPNLLLLDEPTNYLDILSIRWLTDYLNSWQNEMIIISHDRHFMDSVTTHTAGIHRAKIKKVQGGTQKFYEQIILEEELHEKTRVNDEKKRKQMDAFIDRFRAKANKASVVQSRIKMRDKLTNLEKLQDIQNLDFDFKYQNFSAKVLLEAQNLKYGYEKDQILINDLSFSIAKNDRIAIIGKNGKGKSTLLNLLANEITPLKGNVKKHPSTEIGYFGQTNINRLDTNRTVEEEIQAEDTTLTRTAVRSICGTVMFDGDKALKKISVLSGGEKSRVLLGKILVHPTNLLFLDEPTNHLDMQSIESLIESLQVYQGGVVLVTHSEDLLKKIATKLIIFHKNKVEYFNGNYDDFLEKIGWEDGFDKKKKKKSAKQDYQDSKKRDKAIRKAKKQMDALEKEITDLEAQIQIHENDIEKASQKQDLQALIDIPKMVKTKKERIEEIFKEMEKLENILS